MASEKPYANPEPSPDIVDLSSDGSNDEKSLWKERNSAGNAHDLTEKLLGINQDTPVDDIEHVVDKVQLLTVDECRMHMEQLLKDHEYDYNFSAAQKHKIESLLAGPKEGESNEDWELQLKLETAVNKFFSPYPEVRAVTTPEDDPNMLCETIRAHFLGYLWVSVGQFINTFFNSRYPGIGLGSSVAQILLYGSGKAFAWGLPDWGFTVRGTRHSLNPGPWTYKEQMLATIIVDVGLGTAYVFDNIQTQEVWYKDTWLTPAYGIMLILSTQFMGLGFAGLLRRFVVYPTQTFWPGILPTLALNRALLLPSKKETIHGWSISRYKCFWIFFIGSFIYFWIPNYLFQALSYFSWMCWIAPNNFNLAVVTGSSFGLGFNPLSSFDWNIIGGNGPLVLPVFSFVQQYIGCMFSGFIILALYYTNTRWTAYLPINSSAIHDNMGNRYNITRVMKNGLLNQEAYEAYSPAFYTAAQLVLFGSFFAFYTFTFAFVLLDAWRPLLKAYRQVFASAYGQIKRCFSGLKAAMVSFSKGKFGEGFHHLRYMMDDGSSCYDGFDDPFTNMMRQYPEVPDWWFLALFFVSFILAIILLKKYHELQTPTWTIFFVVGLSLVFLVPMTYLASMAGTTASLNIITELIVGYALPGRPEALMFVKAYGYNSDAQADNYISDQKMGHYAKIPPRAMYRGQIVSVFISSLICYGVIEFVDHHIDGICTPHQKQKFTCVTTSGIYFSSSVIWGAMGPKRIFGQLYPGLKYFFLLGFLLAIIWWSVKRGGARARSWLRAHLPTMIFKPLNALIFIPLSLLKNVHPSLVILGMLNWAPTNFIFWAEGLYFSIAFMYYLKRYKVAWWEKYDYVISSALEGGIAFSAIIIFFAVQYKKELNVNWWGNNVVSTGVDGYAGQSARFTELPAEGFFGPKTWY